MKRFRSILYVCESSVDQDVAIARAASLARNNRSRLTLLDVAPALPGPPKSATGVPDRETLQETFLQERREQLEDLAARGGAPDAAIEVRLGRPFFETIRAVLGNGHDVVIKPAQDPDWSNRLFGSDDMHLLRKCPCPVWLVKPGERHEYDRIVAAVDIDDEDADTSQTTLNREILELAASLALADAASLHIVHAWDAPEAGLVRLWSSEPEKAERSLVDAEHERHAAAMDHLCHALRKHLGDDQYSRLSPRMHMKRGRATQVIPPLVNDLGADVVVMGTVARTGVPGLLIGNTAETILDQLQCSTLAVKPAGFVSPVTLD
jgi:nucleotide-binding universal stress UspA family protein